jgi:hypothetical protein
MKLETQLDLLVRGKNTHGLTPPPNYIVMCCA